MVFLSVDEVAEFVALMRMVADRRGVVGFRRVAQLFGVSASVVRTIEARAAHLIGVPPTALAVQLSARWNAAHLLQSSADETWGAPRAHWSTRSQSCSCGFDLCPLRRSSSGLRCCLRPSRGAT